MYSVIMVSLFAGDNSMLELLEGQNVSVLSTDFKGVPFGSLVPFVLDADGNPVIYISDLAVHTKNLKKNSACSLTVFKEDEDDVFNSSRITFVGKMEKINSDDVSKAFFEKHKSAEKFNVLGDFHFYKMKIEKIHYIGGFGDINWVKPEDYKDSYKKKETP